MRYVIHEKAVDKDHPYLKPGQTLFYLMDTFTNRLSLGCYTNEEIAKYWCRKRNNVKE